MRTFAIAFALAAVAGLTVGMVHPDAVLEAGFRGWMANHNKAYESAEEFASRFANYKANMAEAARLNLAEPAGGAVFGETPYSDMTFDEFEGRFLGRVGQTPNSIPQWQPAPGALEGVPENHDWREHGLVMPIRDQGACGSCWAFGATATMEAAVVKAGGDPIIVSTSLFVDCDHATGNQGCNGGMEYWAFEYAIDNGVVDEDTYPYVPQTRKCSRSEDMPVAATFSSRERGPNGDEVAMAAYSHETGVLSVGIYVNSALMNYSGGIFQGKCPSRVANHAVNIVGWGVEDGTPYWLIKNSWGPRWGEDGYFRIHRGSDICGISQDIVQIYV